MFTEIVRFPIPPGMTREDVLALYEKTAPGWRATPELLSKQYLYDAEKHSGGGVYLWKTLEAAHRHHGPEFRQRVLTLYGAEPTIEYFETPILVDNVHPDAVEAPV